MYRYILSFLMLFVLSVFSYGQTITTNLTLDKDMVIDEDLIVDGAILNLDTFTLTVNGNLEFKGYNSRLQMTKLDSKLIVTGDLTFGGASTYNDLTKGVIELAGNFYQKGTRYQYRDKSYHDYVSTKSSTTYSAKYLSNNAYSFYPTGTNKIILNGPSKQIVDFEASEYSRFNDLEIQNESAEGVVFNQLNVVGEWARNGNNVKITYIRNLTLTEDYTIPNSLTISSGYLNLNGYSLTVNGNMTSYSARINVNTNTLTVNGNLKFSGYNSRLYMNNLDSKVVVTGDLTFGGASTYEDLTKGVIELSGNFYQKGTRYQYRDKSYHDYVSTKSSTTYSAKYLSDNAYSFYPTDTHKVILNGTSKQVVSFEGATYSRFNDLEIQNESAEGVVFEQLNVVGEWKRNGNNVKITDIRYLRLTEDYTIPNDVVINDGRLNLNGYNLTIDGDLLVNYAYLFVDSHTLKVNGNLKIQGYNSRLFMRGYSSKVIVSGDLTFAGASTYEDLTKGVIELAGNFYQKGTDTTLKYVTYTAKYVSTLDDTSKSGKYQSNNAYSFYPNGTHKVILNGTEKQIVNFEAPNSSKFNNLEIQNESDEGVIFDVKDGKKVRIIGTLYTYKDLYEDIYKDSAYSSYTYYTRIFRDYDEDGIPNIFDKDINDKDVKFVDEDNDGLIDELTYSIVEDVKVINTPYFNDYKLDDELYSVSSIDEIVVVNDKMAYIEANHNTKDIKYDLKVDNIELVNGDENSYSIVNDKFIANKSGSITIKYSSDKLNREFLSTINLLSFQNTKDVQADAFEDNKQALASGETLFDELNDENIYDYSRYFELKTSGSTNDVSVYKIAIGLRGDPLDYMLLDDSIDGKFNIELYSDFNGTVTKIGTKSINPLNPNIIELVLDNSKKYYFKISTENIEQIEYFITFFKENYIYNLEDVSDENGNIEMKFFIPNSQSYKVAIGSIDSTIQNANLYYENNILIKPYHITNKTVSVDDIGLRAGLHTLKLKLKEPNKKFKFMLYKDTKNQETEPNDFLGFIDTYKNGIIGDLNGSDVDNFMIKVKSKGDLTIDLNNTIDSENETKAYFRLLGADESSLGKKKIVYLKDSKYTFSDVDAGLYILRIEPIKLEEKIDYKLNITGDLDYTYKNSLGVINENRYYQDIINRGSKIQSSTISNTGNLIILTGDSDNSTDPLYLATQRLSKTIYKRFSLRGLDEDKIFWINNNSQIDLDYDGVVDNPVDDTNLSLSHFEDSFNWAKEQKNSGPLYLYMVGYGTNGAFRISNKNSEILYAEDLKEYIDTFIEATQRDVVVIIEASKSGSFNPILKAGINEDKIAVITSSEAGKISYIDGYGSISFTKFFVDELLRGGDIKTSFDNAKIKLSSQGGVYNTQVPTISKLSQTITNTKIAGGFAIPNISLTTIDSIKIDDNENYTSLDLTQNSKLEVSADITAGSGIQRVWATLLPPIIEVDEEDFTTPDLSSYEVTLNYDKYKKSYISDYSFNKNSINGKYSLLLNVEDLDGFVYSKTLEFDVSGSTSEINTTIISQEYNTTTKLVNIGWSMNRLPVAKITEINSLNNVEIVWGYENSKWSAYSPKEITTSLIKQKNIEIIDTTKESNGYWIFTKKPIYLEYKDKEIVHNFDSLEKGWHLLSSSGYSDMSIFDNVSSVWNYSDGHWNTYKKDNSSSLLLLLTEIQKNDAFWVHIK